MRTMLEETEPFHDGELALQRATGERDIAARNGRIIADRLAPNAAGFIARQELMLAATVDADGQPWCSALIGAAGSFTAPDVTHVVLARTAARPDDPMWSNLAADHRIGLLFVELGSRKRYRVNGQVAKSDAGPVLVDVAETLGNCPKYITRRHLVVGPPRSDGPAPQVGSRLDDPERRIIAEADMCFVASADPAGNLDASHRGGRPGFVQLRHERLWIPDYRGNSMFNTLGNLRVHPPAGLLFVDFTARETLQLTGTTTVELHTDDPSGATGGTGRAWTFTPLKWRRAPLPARVRAEALDLSPFNP